MLPKSNADAAPDARRLKILLVEDEVLIRMDAADSLRVEGWQVVEAGTAADALAILARSSFDVLLTDVRMPGDLSGLDLIRIVRLSNPDIKIAIKSGGHVPSGDFLADYDVFYPKPVFNLAFKVQKLIEMEGL